jgi:disulfide bond formation protein DsbB
MTNDTPEPVTALPLAEGSTPELESLRATRVESAVVTRPAVLAPVALALEHWPLLALAASALMLGAAHAFETFGGLAPCLLCLKQREVYWTAATVAVIAIVLSRSAWAERVRKPALFLLALIFLYGAGLAAYHAGVEWKWWPGPTACAGGGAVAADDLVGLLKGGKVKPPSCDEAAWIFLGVSMAGWNALVSLGLAAVSAAAGLRKAARS